MKSDYGSVHRFVLLLIVVFCAACSSEGARARMLLDDSNVLYVASDSSVFNSLENMVKTGKVVTVDDLKQSGGLRSIDVSYSGNPAQKMVMVYTNERSIPSGTMFQKMALHQAFDAVIAQEHVEGIVVNYTESRYNAVLNKQSMAKYASERTRKPDLPYEMIVKE